MGIGVKIEPVRGSSAKAIASLRKMQQRVRNPSLANKQVSIWLFRWVNENFKTEGGKVGGWKPFRHGGRILPDRTVDTSAKLLQDKGALRLSFKNFSTRNSAGIGSDIAYSRIHELGLPSKNLAARRMIPLESDKDVDNAVVKIYDAFILRGVG